ncbi:MAG TPA: type II toxin-antitoxin system VapC family toxin [Candidatus Eremiobacteraceae bacterium]|nr:type II toxin-antitoxin system VapC family toxin [Candidatus Eremiobacteraceae bacterium]
MNTFVVDSSVVAKWLPPLNHEPFAAEARKLLAYWTDGKIDLSVPDLLNIEVANILWKAARTKRCTWTQARTALEILISYGLPLVPSVTLLELALRISLEYERTVYDCLYVALAVQSSRTLVTADEKLAKALAAYFPVKWIGAI